MYICNNCHKKVAELNTYNESQPYGKTYANQVMTNYDCDCSGEFEEAEECQLCGECVPVDDLTHGICYECRRFYLAPEVVRQWIDSSIDLSAQFFVSYVFGGWLGKSQSTVPTELIEICKNDFDKNDKNPYLADGCKLDLLDFAELKYQEFWDWVGDETK